jgi:histidinol dehydrogenase
MIGLGRLGRLLISCGSRSGANPTLAADSPQKQPKRSEENPMPRHIMTAALAGRQEEADAKTRATVEAIIADVKARGDGAVRELSERFDKWSPARFRLSADEIAALVAQVSPQTARGDRAA